MTSALALSAPAPVTRYQCAPCHRAWLGQVVLTPACPQCQGPLMQAGHWDLCREGWPSWIETHMP